MRRFWVDIVQGLFGAGRTGFEFRLTRRRHSASLLVIVCCSLTLVMFENCTDSYKVNSSLNGNSAANLSTPAVTLTLDSATVSLGSSVNLTWSSTGATSCLASGGWSGNLATSGTQSLTPATSSVFVIKCTGPTGTATTTANVTVIATPGPLGSTCQATNGSLNLSAKISRVSGISPLLVFFDATATTDSSIQNGMTAFQDVTYNWNFGDLGVSGTGFWASGANPGHNSKNVATGGVGSHLYILPDGAGDTTATATVTATNGSQTATCQLNVKIYDPSGVNGFPGLATTCVNSDGVAGTGCPVGATVANQGNFTAALSTYGGSGKRVLFKCGNKFTGDAGSPFLASKWSIGAYGGCQNTTTNRPILSDSGTIGHLLVGTSSGSLDGRIADLDLEGNANTGLYEFGIQTYGAVNQLVAFNILMNGTTRGFYSAGSEIGVVQLDLANYGAGGLTEGVYFNSGASCANGSTAFQCGQGANAVYGNVNYNAIIGSRLNGPPGGKNVYETFREGACRFCVFTNSDFTNAGSAYAVFKLHNGSAALSNWLGQYTEYIEISDNLFTGASGAWMVEIAPQNSSYDERLQNIVLERNLWTPTSVVNAAVISGLNITFRDNIISGMTGVAGPVAFFRRGVEWNTTPPLNPMEPEYLEAYNNTCVGFSSCLTFDSHANNSFVANNLMFNVTGGALLQNSGTNIVATSNSLSVTANPLLTNGTGSWSVISDFRPTANYTGGTTVPVFFDALGGPWSSIWDLGAVHH